jgi:hypothetical protein
MSAFIALMIGSVLGSFRDPAVILLAIVCAVMGRAKVMPFWPFFLSFALTAFGALMTRFVWHSLEMLRPEWEFLLVWRFYINCAIGYVIYGIFRIAHRDPKNTAK